MFWAAVGCSQVLGIDEAFVDPALERGAGGGSGTGGSHSGGNTVSAATGGNPLPGGASGMGEAGSSAGAAGAANPVDVCERQCAELGEFCVGDALQYRDNEQCLRICRALPPGASDDDRVNTASCRARYADKVRYLAGPELATTCRYAGPGGDGRCGSNCEGLCTVIMAACGPGLSDPFFYPSLDDCLLDCRGVPKADSGYVYGTVAAGASLECRLFHASSAIMSDPDEHCEHALGITLCAEQE